MDNMSFRTFCDSSFWDSSLTWNTSVPDFTQCFQSIALELIPLLCFWLIAVINIWHTSKVISRPPLPWTLLLFAKLGFTMLLAVISIADLGTSGYSLYTGGSLSGAELCASSVKTVTFIFLIFMLLQQKKSGITSSSVLSVFWLIMSIGGAIVYRSSFIKLYYAKSTLISERKFTLDMIYYPLIFLQFILSLFSDTKNYRKVKGVFFDEEVPFFSFLTFHWFNSVILETIKRHLTVQDFFPLLPQLQCRNVFQKFTALWCKKQKTTNKDDGKCKPSLCDTEETETKQLLGPSLIIVLIKSFWPWILIAVVLELIFDVMKFFPALILDLLIDFTSNDEYVWRGYFYCCLIFVTASVEKIVFHMVLHHSMSAALQFKSALSSAVYRKALKLSNDTRRKYTLGELVSLMAVDIDKVFNSSEFFTSIFGAPIKIVLTIILLWQYLGLSCLAGVAVVVIVVVVSSFVLRVENSVQEEQMETKDLRLKYMSEILNGIKVLKLCTWEIPFMKNIEEIRNKEVRLIKIFQFCYAMCAFIWSCSPFLVAVACFSTYLLVSENNILDPSTAFVSLTLMNLLRFALFEVPDVLSFLVQTNIALRRLRMFLTSQERDVSAVGKYPDKGMSISIRKADFSWSSQSDSVLERIDLQVPKGSLVAIVGPVGSGKSSLLSALLGDLYKTAGSVDLTGSIAYVPQQAWIFNETVKQNICFIKPFNEKKYQSVLSNCCLKPDLELLPGGDLTEIGEKGVTLSGGQKQRISLARAVYQNADVYLLDDPLSAVDAHVGKTLFENVIAPRGILRKKTRVLVTHSIAVLSDVDFIVTMKDGKIEQMGTYKELVTQDGPFASFIKEHQQSRQEDESDTISPQVEPEALGFSRAVSLMQRSMSSQSLPAAARITSVDSTSKESVVRLFDEEKMETGESNERTARELDDDIGRNCASNLVIFKGDEIEELQVNRSFYINYMRHASLRFMSGTVFGYLVFQVLEVGGNLWLSQWSTDPINADGTQDAALRNLRIGVYAALGTGQALSILFGTIMLSLAAAEASKIYHQRMLGSVMRCPMSFFDTTPLGRIINRFGKDVDVVDSEIPANIDGWISCFLAVTATCAVIGITTPPFLLSLIPLGCTFFFLQRFYLMSSRQIKRLESTTRSPIFSHFSETMQGVSSIRAYCAEEEVLKDFESKVDINVACYFYWNCSNRWLGLRLDILGNVLVLVAAVLAVASRNVTDGAVMGLSLTYALSVTDPLVWLVRTMSELENQLVSVERIEEYSTLPPEAPWVIKDTRPPSSWPEKGSVSFQEYSTRYRENLDLVLRNVNLDISANEKVGIVGRTGAGKSSITLALFRIIEAAEGRIIIDGLDVSKLGLHDLRSKLTIIPQDPVLFTGSLRVNLDPNNHYSDEELWTSLEHAHLKSFISSLTEGLDFNIVEGGENLSVGQRQLVCLARALLQRTKILVLDEATAAVDMDTDSLIQNTIRQEFANYTVITIAHRINTIMDYDKVVVMDAGRVVETGKPSDLLQEPSSSFSSLARNAGLA